MRNHLGRVGALLALATLCTAIAAAQSVRPVQGSVILARAGSAALYIWNATPYVAQLVSDKRLGDGGLNELEATALSILTERAKAAASDTLTVRVFYEKSGAVSPAYGSATFEGMEQLLTLSAERKALGESGSHWSAELLGGKTPTGLSVSVTGALPPAN